MKRILEVQKQIGALSKNAKNPFFNSEYLDLNDIIIHVTPLLNEAGLILSQPIEAEWVKSQIIDSENGKVLLSSEIHLPDEKNPQKLGACITYFRRYTLKSLLAIAEEDDDGNEASKPEEVKKPKLTAVALVKAKERIDKGETDLLDKLKDTFDLTVDQITTLTP